MSYRLLLPVLALPLAAQAQLSELSRDSHTGNLNNGYSLAPAQLKDVQGSAFLLPDWTPGSLQLNGGGPLLTLPLRYDVYHQELRARRPAGDSVVVPLLRVKEFQLHTPGAARRFVCYPAATLPAEVGGGCGEVRYDSPAVQLLRYERKELVKQAGESSGYASAASVTALQARTYLYLRWAADGRFVALKPKRASLEQALADHPAALAALKARKGSLTTEAELAATLAALAPSL